jgi:hypothetical protein
MGKKLKNNFNLEKFSGTFQEFLNAVHRSAPKQEIEKPFFYRLLFDHFGVELRMLPTMKERFDNFEQANLQLAINALLEREGWSYRLFGISAPEWHELNFSNLSLEQQHNVNEGPVQYINKQLGPKLDDPKLTCVNKGLYLIDTGGVKMAWLIRGAAEQWGSKLTFEIMTEDREHAEALILDLLSEMQRRSIYRGRMFSLFVNDRSELDIAFRGLPNTQREDIILPAATLERIERQSIIFAELSRKLLAAKRHLRRGVLLYGPPGTGKTFTLMYLLSRMQGRTVIIMTGAGMRLTSQSIRMARSLAPATVILEDVDLIAENRSSEHGGGTLLFELLNQMDGLNDDSDVLFLLTTNRADLLEPALSARPGRVDQAIEIALPDADCRRRLIEKYSEGMDVRVNRLDKIIERTNGVSATFIKELLRRAALICAESAKPNAKIVVRDKHINAALSEMLSASDDLTRKLLGANVTVA